MPKPGMTLKDKFFHLIKDILLVFFLVVVFFGGEFLVNKIYFEPRSFNFNEQTIPAHSRLVHEADQAKVYLLDDEETIKEFDDEYETPTDLTEFNKQLSLSLSYVNSAVENVYKNASDLGFELEPLNIYLIPTKINAGPLDSLLGKRAAAYVLGKKGNINVYVSLYEDTYMSSLSHEVSHILWFNFFANTPYEQQYYELREIPFYYHMLGFYLWGYKKEEIFAEDLKHFLQSYNPYSIPLDNLPTRANIGEMEWELQDKFYRFVMEVGNSE